MYGILGEHNNTITIWDRVGEEGQRQRRRRSLLWDDLEETTSLSYTTKHLNHRITTTHRVAKPFKSCVSNCDSTEIRTVVFAIFQTSCRENYDESDAELKYVVVNYYYYYYFGYDGHRNHRRRLQTVL